MEQKRVCLIQYDTCRGRYSHNSAAEMISVENFVLCSSYTLQSAYFPVHLIPRGVLNVMVEYQCAFACISFDFLKGTLTTIVEVLCRGPLYRNWPLRKFEYIKSDCIHSQEVRKDRQYRNCRLSYQKGTSHSYRKRSSHGIDVTFRYIKNVQNYKTTSVRTEIPTSVVTRAFLFYWRTSFSTDQSGLLVQETIRHAFWRLHHFVCPFHRPHMWQIHQWDNHFHLHILNIGKVSTSASILQ